MYIVPPAWGGAGRGLSLLFLLVALCLVAQGTPSSEYRQRYNALKNITLELFPTKRFDDYVLDILAQYQYSSSGKVFMVQQAPATPNVYHTTAVGEVASARSVGYFSILNNAENDLIAAHLERVYDVLAARPAEGTALAFRYTDDADDFDSLGGTTFSGGCDAIRNGSNCIKLTLGLVPVKDCEAGVHPLCCTLYYLRAGETFAQADRRTLAELDPEEIVWDGTSTVNGYYTRFTARTLEVWRGSACRPLFIFKDVTSAPPPDSMFVFAVDANGEWSLTTDLNLLTIQLHYLPVQGNQVGVDLTGSVPGSPTAGWTAESMLGADTFAAAGLRGMPPPRPRVGGYYGNMNYVIPEVLSLLLLAILLVLLVALYLFGVARRKGEVQELRATTVEPNFEHNNDRSWEEMGTRAGGNLILLDASQEGGVAKGGDLTPDEDDDDPNADRLSLSLSLSDDEREEARKERERLANVPPPPAPVEEVVVPLARTDRRGSRRKTSSTGDSKKTPETTSESSNKRGRRKPYVPLPVADLTTPFIPPATRDPGPAGDKKKKDKKKDKNKKDPENYVSLRQQRDLAIAANPNLLNEDKAIKTAPYANSYLPPKEAPLPSAIQPSRYRRTFNYDKGNHKRGDGTLEEVDLDPANDPYVSRPRHHQRSDSLGEADGAADSASTGSSRRLISRNSGLDSSTDSVGSRRSNIVWQLEDIET